MLRVHDDADGLEDECTELRFTPPAVGASQGVGADALKQTQQSLRPLQEQPRQLQHFPDQRVPRRWCAARLLSRAQEARAKRRCRDLGIRFSPVK